MKDTDAIVSTLADVYLPEGWITRKDVYDCLHTCAWIYRAFVTRLRKPLRDRRDDDDLQTFYWLRHIITGVPWEIKRFTLPLWFQEFVCEVRLVDLPWKQRSEDKRYPTTHAEYERVLRNLL